MAANPIFILAPGRCFSSLICAMIGQHPQFYGLLETQLLARDTLQAWWESFGNGVHSHGLSRAVAEIVYGGQSAYEVQAAREWLWLRRERSTADLLAELAALVHPLVVIEKTPMVTYSAEHMERTRENFPDARFLHLVRHPIGYGCSLLEFYHRFSQVRSASETEALLCNPESIFFGLMSKPGDVHALDPQRCWYLRQSAVVAFLRGVPPRQQMRMRAEDLLVCPSASLGAIARWAGVRDDPFAIEEMTHPERSPFASIGPWNARLGGDPKFLKNPVLQSAKTRIPSLEDPIPWSSRGSRVGLRPEVKSLASEFGYH
jgi:hypothetical protein